MELFHGFTVPIWEIFYGNLLLFLCSLFYLLWWIVTFRPGAVGGAFGTFCLAAACVSGIAAIALASTGISALAPDSKGVPVRCLVAGGVVLYLVLLAVTVLVFHRMVTSELLIMQIWAVLELSVVSVLYGAGRFPSGVAAALAALVVIASVAGLVCYVLYYHLDASAGYRDGMVPLITDAAVMAVFLVTTAVL